MFKDYYSFKTKNKRVRWVYDRETSEWKRERTPRYSERYLNQYLFWWLVLVCLFLVLVLIFSNLPFTEQLGLKIFDAPLLFLDWFLYGLLMIAAAAFIRRFWRAMLFCVPLSIIAFFASDMLLLNYDTPLYIYFATGTTVSLVFLLCARFIRYLLKREPEEKQKESGKKRRNLL